MSETHRQASRLIKRQEELGVSLGEFGTSLMGLGKFEPGPLADQFMNIGEKSQSLARQSQVHFSCYVFTSGWEYLSHIMRKHVVNVHPFFNCYPKERSTSSAYTAQGSLMLRHYFCTVKNANGFLVLCHAWLSKIAVNQNLRAHCKTVVSQDQYLCTHCLSTRCQSSTISVLVDFSKVQIQAEALLVSFEAPLKEFVRLVKSAKSVMNDRSSALQSVHQVGTTVSSQKTPPSFQYFSPSALKCWWEQNDSSVTSCRPAAFLTTNFCKYPICKTIRNMF